MESHGRNSAPLPYSPSRAGSPLRLHVPYWERLPGTWVPARAAGLQQSLSPLERHVPGQLQRRLRPRREVSFSHFFKSLTEPGIWR